MDTGAGRKTVRVTIFNQSYTLAAADGGAEEMKALARSVDVLMCDIAARMNTGDGSRVAVLTCLHLADRLRSIEDELADLKARVDSKTRQFSAARSSHRVAPPRCNSLERLCGAIFDIACA